MIVCTILVTLAYCFSSEWSAEFDYETYIDENQLFKLYWNDLPDDIIEFGIEVKSTGWIALGISPRGQMPDSDIAIGWVDDNGNVYLQDRYTNNDRITPLYDTNQNLTLISGEESNGMTRIRFTRPKYTCDDNDISISTGTTRLIWAFHATQDPEEECFDSDTIQYHTNKGSQSMNLESGIPEQIELEDDVTYIDIVMDGVSVPSHDTTYYCKLFKLPVFNETQHIVKFESIIQDGNEATVHHMIAYYCPEYLITNDSHIGVEGPCDEWSENMPSRQCRGERMAYVWAVGGNDLYMPQSAGMPLSGDSGFHYVFMEIHYDNPLKKSGIVDSSGFRMYVTPTLRENDVGILMIGLNINYLGQWIPPGLSNAHNAGFMSSECTENSVPDEGIKVFGSFLHQHTIGKALNFRHIRNGTELTPIDTNLNYDFNYQQTIIFDEHITILPGDSFIIDCWTDSRSRTEITISGETSSQEMCLEFLLYYPSINLRSALVVKEKHAFKEWLIDAQEMGYLSGNKNDIETYDGSNISALTYYSDIDGAEEFYNRLYSTDYDKYNKHRHWCIADESEYGIINSDHSNATIPHEFKVYDVDINNCDHVNNLETQLIGECVPYDNDDGEMSKDDDDDDEEISRDDDGTHNKGILIRGYASIFLILIMSYHLV